VPQLRLPVCSSGRGTVQTIHESATALATGTVVRTSDETLPTVDPIYIDLETDGLSGNTVWLVGVLNGQAESGRYYPFRQREVDDAAAHIEGFLMWLAGTDPSRPVVAWNGHSFDFGVLARQIKEHCPDRLETWNRRQKLDLLMWADYLDNAILPGRTNRLEDVAGALGWEPTTAGISGEIAATVYTRWRRQARAADSPAEVTDPGWETLEAYCEDDVRALATIYQGIQNGEPAARPRSHGHSSQTTGTQGSLSDFS